MNTDIPRNDSKREVSHEISEIDRKIDAIRKKYQEYSGQSINYGKYNIAEPQSYSKSTLEKAEELKKRSFNYLKQYERVTIEPKSRKTGYEYSRY